jgi:hypothetical protein
MLLDENVTLICGVQIKCFGEEAIDEILWDEDPVGIPICSTCKQYLTQTTDSDTLD